MNVLRQNLFFRLVVLIVFTSLVSLPFYFLQETNWAEAIRDATLLAANTGDEETGSGRPYIFRVLGSLLKATVLIGIPLLLTLGINRIRKRFI